MDTGENEVEQVQWSEDRNRISMSYQGNWQEAEGNAEHQSQLIYVETNEAIRVSLRDEFVMGDESYTDSQQLHALNDDQNSIEIISEFNWSEGSESGKWQSHAVVNDRGGKLGTTATFAGDPVIWHTRERFDENGELASSEYCEETQGIDCSDAANWQQADFDFASTVELDMEEADYDLQEAYLQACEEMNVSDDDCGFSESEMVIIEGANDWFENTDDVIVYLCIETGEDELVCRSETEDMMPTDEELLDEAIDMTETDEAEHECNTNEDFSTETDEDNSDTESTEEFDDENDLESDLHNVEETDTDVSCVDAEDVTEAVFMQ